MGNSMKKTVLCCAMGAVMGGGATAANAAGTFTLDVTGFTLKSVAAFGGLSDFNFGGPPVGGNTFGPDPEAGCTNAEGAAPTCDDIEFTIFGGPAVAAANNDLDDFTTGFNFGGGGIFQPKIEGPGGAAGSISAMIDPVLALAGDGQGLMFTSLDFAGVYQGSSNFALDPDVLVNCTGNTSTFGNCGEIAGNGGTFSDFVSDVLGYNVQIADVGGGDYDVSVTYVGSITEAGGFLGNPANWKLNGTLHTQAKAAVPVPAAAWLFGSGLMGLVGVARRRKTA